MKNQITNLHIENFKSIKSIDLDCKRINVFVGRPNVGKSNILEALSLYSARISYDIQAKQGENGFLKKLVRFESYDNLFYDSDRTRNISVISNMGSVYLQFNAPGLYSILSSNSDSYAKSLLQVKDPNQLTYNYNHTDREIINSYDLFHLEFSDALHTSLLVTSPFHPIVKKYSFRKDLSRLDNGFAGFLLPPDGQNLVKIIELLPRLRKEIVELFREYGLEPVLDTTNKTLEIQKRIEGFVYKVPYSLMADTLQRIIFHLAAIYSNDDSILLFEEPEAHSFPPYIAMLADKIVETKNNQFFITTQSSDILNTFLGLVGYDELAIFLCYYEDYQTKVKQLSEEEFGNLLDTGADIFFNIDAYLPK